MINIIAMRSGRARIYLIASEKSAPVRGAFRYKSSTSIIITATTTASKEMALSKKAGPVSNASIMKPESAGPIKRAVLKFTEFNATEFGTSSSGASSGTKECRTGQAIVAVSPRPNEITNTCHNWTWPVATHKPSTPAHKKPEKLVNTRSFGFDIRSAKVPPKRENSDGAD
jgi:hypothetical protein